MADRDRDQDRTRVSLVDANLGLVVAGRYRLELRLAAGGFGAVYHATDLADNRDVAIKIMHGQLADDPAVVARFRREGDALIRLRDPHTIRAYEVGELPDGRLYIVMELLHGESLHERLREQGAIPWRRAVAIARAICSSLAEAHALGIVHRDLKPANIFLEPRDGGPEFVKVLDFGIAKTLDGGALETGDLTHAGQMIGTFDYMSPEQMLGGECTGRSDIFTVGVLVYEMISGARPFGDADTAAAMLFALLHVQPQPLTARFDLPAELDRAVRRCLHHDPAQRFATVGELVAIFDEVAPRRLIDFVDEEATVIDSSPKLPVAFDASTVVDTSPRHDAIVLGTTLPGVAPPAERRSWPLLVRRKPR